MRKLPGILLKLAIISGILIALSIGVLKLLERKPELLREGIEKYFSESTGLSAKIEKTNWIKFYPSLDISLEKISFYEVSDADFFPMTIEALSFKMPFISMLFNLRRFEDIKITGLKAKPDVVFPKAIQIDDASIYDDKVLPPEIKISGLYDGAKMNIGIGLEREEISLEKSLYEIGAQTPFTMKIGMISVNGVFIKEGNKSVLRQGLLQVGDKLYGPQDIDTEQQGEYSSLVSCLLAHGANETLVKAHCTGYFNDEHNDTK